MTAIYEVQFMDKRAPEVLSDTRRKAAPATQAGFLRVVAWAKGVTGSNEMIGSIRIIATEKP